MSAMSTKSTSVALLLTSLLVRSLTYEPFKQTWITADRGGGGERTCYYTYVSEGEDGRTDGSSWLVGRDMPPPGFTIAGWLAGQLADWLAGCWPHQRFGAAAEAATALQSAPTDGRTATATAPPTLLRLTSAPIRRQTTVCTAACQTWTTAAAATSIWLLYKCILILINSIRV